MGHNHLGQSAERLTSWTHLLLLQFGAFSFRLFGTERLYLQGGKDKLDAVGDHARRLQRLQEILNQLKALTAWRKL